MTSWKAARGHRRTAKTSNGDPGRVRRLKLRSALERDACRFPGPCGCELCRPEPYDETDDRS